MQFDLAQHSFSIFFRFCLDHNQNVCGSRAARFRETSGARNMCDDAR
jgi:hypothetical protein